jgi:pimeloyl-ACP methyl ester carboxylesterase
MTTTELLSLQKGPSDVSLEMFELGEGPPLLVLHGELGLGEKEHDFLAMLATDRRVIAPSHPGFGRSSMPDSFDSIDDLAYFYLDLIEDMKVDRIDVVGLAFGGWIASEMVVRRPSVFSRLVLVDSFGLHIGDRENRAIADIFALSAEELARRSFHEPSDSAANVFDYPSMSSDEIQRLLRNQEAVAVYGWEPYLHSPKLGARLARVQTPSLVLWGASDGIVDPAYGRTFADSMGNASFELIDAAGHYPEREQPEILAARIRRFLNER